jgi:hypothetical protein
MNEKLQESEHWQNVGFPIYRELPGSRPWAFTDGAKVALGALTLAWKEVGNSFAGDGPEQFGRFLRHEVGPLVPDTFVSGTGVWSAHITEALGGSRYGRTTAEPVENKRRESKGASGKARPSVSCVVSGYA